MMSLAVQRTAWSRTLESLCGWSAVGLVFAAPVSRSLFLLCASLFLIAWAAHPDWRLKWQSATGTLVAKAIGLLAMCLGV